MNMLNVSTKRINLFKSHLSIVILQNERVKCVKKKKRQYPMGDSRFFKNYKNPYISRSNHTIVL